MKKYKDFSTSSLNTEDEKAYLDKLYKNHYDKAYKKKYSKILEDKYQVVREDTAKSNKSAMIIRLGKYALGAAACAVLIILALPLINNSGTNLNQLVQEYSTKDILMNREIKRGQAMDDEFRIEAIQNYNAGNFATALESYEKIDQPNDEDMFWKGMTQFYMKDYLQAEATFTPLQNAENLKFKAELNWYYTLSLLQNGKTEEAKEQLKTMDSWKSEEARKLLKAIKD